MSSVYTYSEARQNLASLLEKAIYDGEVRVKRKDGQIFVILPDATVGSPLDIESIDLDLTKEEIIEFIHEGRQARERDDRP